MRKGPYDAGGRRKYLNRKENLRFMKAVDEQPVSEACLCRLLFYCGCRLSEALNLEPEDIDWDDQTVVFRTLKKRERYESRRVPIPPSLTRSLRGLGATETGARLWAMSRTTAWRRIKVVMETAGISGVQATAKGLRHSFGVRAAMSGVPVHVLRDWMGHADTSTTEIYIEVRGGEERELIRRTWKV